MIDMHPNRAAFLDAIGVAEGTSTSRATRNHGYDVIVTGIDGVPEIFTDYSTHPFEGGRLPKVINSKGLRSTASGKFQIMLRDWPHYRALLALPDFGPDSQVRYALQLIRERSALPLIDAGQFAAAVRRVSNLWASLPGAGYNQPERAMDTLQVAYVKAGGRLA